MYIYIYIYQPWFTRDFLFTFGCSSNKKHGLVDFDPFSHPNFWLVWYWSLLTCLDINTRHLRIKQDFEQKHRAQLLHGANPLKEPKKNAQIMITHFCSPDRSFGDTYPLLILTIHHSSSHFVLSSPLMVNSPIRLATTSMEFPWISTSPRGPGVRIHIQRMAAIVTGSGWWLTYLSNRTVNNDRRNICIIYHTYTSSGWWYTYPSEKWWSSSVGMMRFPIWWENKSHVPNHQPEVIQPDTASQCCENLTEVGTIDHFARGTIWLILLSCISLWWGHRNQLHCWRYIYIYI